jgi:hypothetical protein
MRTIYWLGKAYDTNAILGACEQQGTAAVIAAKLNRKHV